MNITVQCIKFDADPKLVEFINKKAEKLEQFLDNIIDGLCNLRVESVGGEADKFVEFKFNIPGNQLFAKAQAKSFEEAIDIALESIRRQINKHKTKTRTNASNHKEVINQTEEF